MDKDRKMLAAIVVKVLIEAPILAGLLFGRARRVFTFLFRRGEFSLRRLQFIWEADPVASVQFAICVLLAFALIVNLIRGVAAMIRISGRGRAVPPLDQPEDRTVSHSYRSGNERYLAQLDDFLRDGVITKEEFIELKRRFGKENNRNGL